MNSLPLFLPAIQRDIDVMSPRRLVLGARGSLVSATYDAAAKVLAPAGIADGGGRVSWR